MTKIKTPQSKYELMDRCDAIAGLTLSQLAYELNTPIPDNLLLAKGWVGQLIEAALGATSGSRPQPDFHHLGIELKTLPLNQQGKPKESTFVCTAPILASEITDWLSSIVCQKLSHVLWVPVEASPDIAVGERRIGSAILWQPNEQQWQILKNDWQEITDMIRLGQLDQITAKHGQYLQLRPKAANAKALRQTINAEGDKAYSLPRGFYLRTIFTQQILLSAGQSI